MGRRKAKPKQQRYLPGARWQDVVYGRGVVTHEDVDRAKRARDNRVAYHCRDCAFACRLAKRGGTLRCEKCGGVLDPT
jgi:hypothetical protein